MHSDPFSIFKVVFNDTISVVKLIIWSLLRSKMWQMFDNVWVNVTMDDQMLYFAALNCIWTCMVFL